MGERCDRSGSLMEFGSMSMLIGGRRYLYDPSKVTLTQAMVIQEHTGMGLIDWDRAVTHGDPKAVTALYWVVRQQSGDPVALDDIVADSDSFHIGEFQRAYIEAFEVWVARAVKKQEEADRKAAPKAGGSSPRNRPATRKATATSRG